MCWHTDQAKESWSNKDGKLRITFEPAPTDLRCCIGGGGAVIKGLQHVASVIGKLNGYPVSIHLGDNFTEEREDHAFEQCISFADGEIIRIVSSLLASAFQREVRAQRRRSNDLLEIRCDARNEGEKTIIRALNEPLYAYGFRQGCVIKLLATSEARVAA